jgi:hypothetical protein
MEQNVLRYSGGGDIMEQRMKVALAEVNSVLENSEEEITKKIPEKFKEYVKTNMDKEFVPNVIPGLAIFAQPVSLEAKELLRLIYRDFLASKEERDILLEKEREVLKVEEKKEDDDENIVKEENLSKESIAENNNEQLIEEKEKEKQEETEEEKHTELIKVEEKWYQKLFAWIKKLVNRAKL